MEFPLLRVTRRGLFSTSGVNFLQLPEKVNTVILSPDNKYYIAYEEKEDETSQIYYFSTTGKLLNIVEVNIYCLMSDRFKNKYRIESTRLQHWDYGWTAAYFVTICTKDRICLFGDVINGKMKLSHVGIIANVLWYEIKNHAKNVELGEFVVMPNHVHGILILNGDNATTINDTTDTVTDVTNVTNVETRHALSLQPVQPKSSDKTATPPPPYEPQNKIGQQRFQNQGKNTLSSIVGAYKSAVTKHCRRLCYNFAWQSRFHDHIIRNENSFHNISEYIINNPMNWSGDKFFK